MEPRTVPYGTMSESVIPILGKSALRRDILAWLFARPGVVVHPRELGRQLNRAPQPVARELARLQTAGILTSETVGRARRYRVDNDSPIASGVESLIANSPDVKQADSGSEPTTAAERIMDSHREAIEALMRKHGVQRLEVFGSAARDDFDPERSDIDLLVEFGTEATPSLFSFVRLQEALAAIVGFPVDLVVARAVKNPYMKAAIDSDRRLVYAA